MSIKISVVIIAKNEEKKLPDCLKSVAGWADEIILVDDHSTDKTYEIAKQYTDKIFSRKMDLEGKHRNYAVAQAKNDWVFLLDCDERASEELKKEITQTLTSHDGKTMAYWIPARNFLGEFELKHGGWQAPHLRMYNKNFLKWREVPHDVVHPGYNFDPKYTGGNLKNFLIHYGFANVEEFIRKVNNQTTLEAIKWHLSGTKMGLGKAIWRMIDRFFRRFIGKGGYKDGYYGFVGAVLSGFYQFAAYSKLREIKERGAYLEEFKNK
ncbi:hypothetical protein MNBD_UNCLBAC01-1120 [hydrothermal vent metagenome]|uniref:Glycosyltransferase 2-like domain-containing protein n=1 Tax=hydrothermal vent metagenome TaxID=652676 RepID=A0A3B1DIS3_9ZZZZ